jgi:regulator of protease activity HflC (stomatin/prohibitin superfamily)
VEKVAPAYQNVIGALEEKETEILKARAYASTILPQSQADAEEIVVGAESAAWKKRTVAAAESERFRKQMQLYRAMPAMFRLNARMELLENEAKDIRKYVVSSTLADEVYQLNFETRERLDLVDIDAAELSNDTAKK